mgnify:CR=1 FL=1
MPCACSRDDTLTNRLISACVCVSWRLSSCISRSSCLWLLRMFCFDARATSTHHRHRADIDRTNTRSIHPSEESRYPMDRTTTKAYVSQLAVVAVVAMRRTTTC